MNTEIRNETELWETDRDEQIGTIARIDLPDDMHTWRVSTLDGQFAREHTIMETAIVHFVEDGFILPDEKERRKVALRAMRSRVALVRARLAEIEDVVSAMWMENPQLLRDVQKDLAEISSLNLTFTAYTATPEAKI